MAMKFLAHLALAAAAALVSCNVALAAPAVTVSPAAKPQLHWVSAVQRNSGTGAQSSFVVRTDWAQFHGQDAKHTGFNRFENTLNVTNVRNLDILWQSPIGQSYG